MRRTAAAVLVFAAACGGSDDAAPTTTTPTAAPVGEVVRTEILDGPDWLGTDDEFLYVKLDGGSVDRVDPATGEVVATVDFGRDGPCQGMGVGFGSVWSCVGPDVVRLDLDAGEVVATIDAGKTAEQGHLATGFDRVWVLQGDGSALAGIDPATNEVGPAMPLDIRGTDLAVDDTGIWIVSALDDAVIKVDPDDGAVLHRIDGLPGPRVLSVAPSGVWVGDAVAVHLIDPATGAVESTYEGGIGGSGAVAADDRGVWVRRGAEIRHLDGGTGAEDDLVTLDIAERSPGDMVVAFGALWTTASEDAALFRVTLE